MAKSPANANQRSGTSSDRSPHPLHLVCLCLCLTSCTGFDLEDEDLKSFMRRMCACVWVGQPKEGRKERFLAPFGLSSELPTRTWRLDKARLRFYRTTLNPGPSKEAHTHTKSDMYTHTHRHTQRHKSTICEGFLPPSWSPFGLYMAEPPS